jgi:hypothetical protein
VNWNAVSIVFTSIDRRRSMRSVVEPAVDL